MLKGGSFKALSYAFTADFGLFSLSRSFPCCLNACDLDSVISSEVPAVLSAVELALDCEVLCGRGLCASGLHIVDAKGWLYQTLEAFGYTNPRALHGSALTDLPKPQFLPGRASDWCTQRNPHHTGGYNTARLVCLHIWLHCSTAPVPT